jgi:hypothetical protein
VFQFQCSLILLKLLDHTGLNLAAVFAKILDNFGIADKVSFWSEFE